MLTKSKCLVVVIAATAFGLFGMPQRVTADEITVGKASQVSGKLQIQGKGTFSVDPGNKLDSVQMVVLTLQGTQVSKTKATVPMGTTEWSAFSDTIPAGTYNVGAILTITTPLGKQFDVPSQNTIQITIQ
jgi:hypothetical protein